MATDTGRADSGTHTAQETPSPRHSSLRAVVRLGVSGAAGWLVDVQRHRHHLVLGYTGTSPASPQVRPRQDTHTDTHTRNPCSCVRLHSHDQACAHTLAHHLHSGQAKQTLRLHRRTVECRAAVAGADTASARKRRVEQLCGLVRGRCIACRLATHRHRHRHTR